MGRTTLDRGARRSGTTLTARRRRGPARAAAVLVTGAVLLGITTPANAYVKTSSLSPAGLTVKVYFTASETRKIAAGGSACATVVSRIPGIGVPVGTACAIIGSAAAVAVANDACVGLHTFRPLAGNVPTVGWPMYHNRSYC